MNKRVTVVLDDNIDKKLRIKQAAMIKQSMSSVRFSQVINETLRKDL